MSDSRDKPSDEMLCLPPAGRRASIRIGKYTIAMPGTRRQRVFLGSGLCLGGILGFLPILGFWMLPLGLVVLSVDNAKVRRLRRRLELRWGRWRKPQKSL